MFCYQRRPQYHETDQMGIIHHANYIKWMEEARIAFLTEIGFPYETMEADDLVSPVVSVNVEYRRPLRFGDAAEIRLRVSRYSGAVLEFAYEIYDLRRDCLCTAAASRHCFVRDGRPVSLRRCKPELDEKLKSLVE